MVAVRIGLGPLRWARPDVVIDTQNGLPFMARWRSTRGGAGNHLSSSGRWRVGDGRIGWFVESKLRARAHRQNTSRSLPSARDPDRSGCAARSDRGGTQRPDEAPAQTLARRDRPRRGSWCAVTPGAAQQIEDALEAVAALHPMPDLHLDILGGGWWEQRLVDHATLLGISDAVTFHGHVDDEAKHRVLQQCWVHVLPSRKEGWGLAVTEAGQHSLPTIGYRSSGGLTDSIVDGVSGLLVDNHDELVDQLERLLTDHVLREQLGAKAQTRSGEFSAAKRRRVRTVLDLCTRGAWSAAWSRRARSRYSVPPRA
jgi:glycosyltransferase involved in cell wall biosynthesis